MQIGSLQKLTLIDYPGKIACILFLFGCNFKCGFCHNPSLVLPEKAGRIILKEEVLDFLERRKKYLDGICITGGEPLINKELPPFIEQIKKIGYSVKIDTNGTNPEMLSYLIDNKLVDYIAMDIKSDRENYFNLTNTEADIKKIEESIRLIVYSGVNYEFRTTCISKYHTKETIEKIGQWLLEIAGEKPKNYVIQKFVRRENGLIDEKFMKYEELSEKEMEELREAAEKYFENTEVRE